MSVYNDSLVRWNVIKLKGWKRGLNDAEKNLEK